MLRSSVILFTFIFGLSLSFLFAQSDGEIQIESQNALRAYSLSTLNVSVQGGSVILKGTVDSCRKRLLADEAVSRIHGVKTIQDRIEVSGPSIPDPQLKTQVDKIIAHRIRNRGRLGYGWIFAGVKNGVVTLSGTATPELAESAIDPIAGIAGARNVVDHVHRMVREDPRWRSNYLVFEGAQAQ
jgi:hyperosmotically inducible periplasmic protein